MIRKLTAKHRPQRFQFLRQPPAVTAVIKEIPTPKRLPIIGTTLSLLAAGSAAKLHEYIDKRHGELGPIFRDKIGPVSAVFVSDPEFMRSIFGVEGKYPIHILPEPWIVYNKVHGCARGLFFMNGEEWLDIRRVMNKFLLKGDTGWLEDSCKVATDNLIKEVEKSQSTINLEGLLYKWSLDVMVAILVGATNFQRIRNLHQTDLDRLAETVHLIFNTTSKLQLFPAELAWKLGLSRWKTFEKSVDDALGSAKDFVLKILQGSLNKDGLLSKMVDEKIEKDLIVRIITDLVLAAGDTTAYSMEWILYLISKNPTIQERLHRDLRSGSISSLPKNIIRESLRLYPVAPFLTRFLPEDANIQGYHIAKNTLVILSIYTSGRDKRYFEEPDEFRPDRWIRQQDGNLKQMLQATMPFAIGARSCIGRRIAEIQLQSALSELVKRFEIVLRNEEDIEMILKMVAVPSKPIRLRFVER